ncbi:hypothetical protein FNV43_RR11005 [Rhamnella rubrinervis]|uniref:Uncharacterized protein n=1 Tax=Rhamnella rubrinervis TaxID=2594499 RepID=A0A8K0H5H4_9ROSA|nr:hypothetical protein FNV43_RR11005 [Rhamnella rubrinervis]
MPLLHFASKVEVPLIAFQPHQHGSDLGVNVRLFGAREVVRDGQERAEEVAVQSQEIQQQKMLNEHELPINEAGHTTEADEDQTTHAQQPEEVESIHAQQSRMRVRLEMDNTGKYSTRIYHRGWSSVRSHAPLVKDWSDVDKEVKKDMIEYLDRLVELRDSTSLSVDEIFMLVLPSKSATFRGIGVIPKSTRSRASEEVAALRKELHESRQGKGKTMSLTWNR